MVFPVLINGSRDWLYKSHGFLRVCESTPTSGLKPRAIMISTNPDVRFTFGAILGGAYLATAQVLSYYVLAPLTPFLSVYLGPCAFKRFSMFEITRGIRCI